MGVDFLGFPLEQGITVSKFKDIAGWISGPTLVVELDDPQAPWLQELPALVYQIQAANVQSLPSMPANQKWIVADSAAALLEVLPALGDIQDQVLFLEVTNWENANSESLARLAQQFQLWARIQDVRSLENLPTQLFAGISLRGFAEERAGLKDYGNLAEVLEALEVVD
jgi:hypothetical protein